MRKIILLLILASILFIASCTQGGNQGSPSNGAPATNTIEITSNGFNPSTLTINAGDTVTWINKDTVEHWPASAVHPIHAVYPESGGCIGSKFDACKGLKQDESWSFTFNQKGTWGYHDHLNSNLRGKIIVQ